MVTEITSASENKQWIRTGDPDFYAVFDQNKPTTLPLVSIHYDGRTKQSPYRILEANYLDPKAGLYADPDGDLNDPANIIRNKFESFLLHLYGAGIFISSTSISHDLDADMVAGGVDYMYEGINILDFMILTNAKERSYKKPADNTGFNLTTLGPTAERPNLIDVPDLGQQTMKDIIFHIGLKGFVPYLYADEAISFDTFVEMIKVFYPDISARNYYWIVKLRPFLISKKVPILIESQINQLLS